MEEIRVTVAVIGSGPAGLAAACSAKENGASRVLIVERDHCSGGILQQCIHAGFGVSYFHEELTGPEYAERFEQKAKECGVEWMFDTTVLELRDHELLCCSESGMFCIRYDAVILAMGCRERTRGNLMIPGTRPSGIYTAGTAQRLINLKGHQIGKNIVILGSGDIGMIMARRMVLEGAKVQCAIEVQPALTGLLRNKIQCLDDFGIPLLLSHTVTSINGKDRVESVSVAPIDEKKQPILEKEKIIPCDTVLISTGLIPENELTRTAGIVISEKTGGPVVNESFQTNHPEVFACGNVLHVTGLVDDVTVESEKVGKNAAIYARKKNGNMHTLSKRM